MAKRFLFAVALLAYSPAHGAVAPDQMAWQVFAEMTMPAKGTQAVQFETWASDDDLYGPNPRWPSQGSPKRLQKSVGGAASFAGARRAMAMSPGQCTKPQDGAAGNFPAQACIGEEVRHNLPVFRYLTVNGFNTNAGLVAAYATHKPLVLPAESIVVKADWVPVDDMLKWQPSYKDAGAIRRAFYTNTASLDGKVRAFALVGLSVQSKQMPDWLWFTIEHRSSPGRCDIIGCHDGFGAATADVAPAATANSDYGPCAKTPALAALFARDGLAPVWDNYCLKGTQTRYVKPDGSATLLGNSVIERMNHGVAIPRISCITCHAYASFDAQGHGNTAVLPLAPRGQVDAKLLDGYQRGDFMWGLLLAK